jgi:hypothetical protein
MTSVPTGTATIYAGFRVGRTADPNPRFHSLQDAFGICQAYCDVAGLCVTITPTNFVYTKGGEPGVSVGLINYPRFPSSMEKIKDHALKLGELLRVGLEQMVVSVVFPDETILIRKEDVG